MHIQECRSYTQEYRCNNNYSGVNVHNNVNLNLSTVLCLF